MELLESIKDLIKKSLPEIQAKELQEYLIKAEENEKELKKVKEALKVAQESNCCLKEKIEKYTDIEKREKELIENEKIVGKELMRLNYENKIMEAKIECADKRVFFAQQLWDAAFKNPVFKNSIFTNRNTSEDIKNQYGCTENGNRKYENITEDVTKEIG